MQPVTHPADMPPSGLPMLGRGRHRDAESGACVMEYVSVLAGERFSDHPRCTHPALICLAQLVNDHVSDEARPELARLAPLLIGTDRRDGRISAVVVARCAATAAAVCRPSRIRDRLLRRALRRASLPRRHALGDAVRWGGAIRAEFSAARQHLAALPEADRDRALCTLLERAVADVRALPGVLDSAPGSGPAERITVASAD